MFMREHWTKRDALTISHHHLAVCIGHRSFFAVHTPLTRICIASNVCSISREDPLEGSVNATSVELGQRFPYDRQQGIYISGSAHTADLSRLSEMSTLL